MAKYLIKRILQTLLVIFLVSVLTFLLVNIMPKDPVYALYGTDISQEEYNIAYHAMNLDQSIVTRYFIWLGNVLHGDFGISYRYHSSVLTVMGAKVGVTMWLSVISTLISFPIGIWLGVTCAVKRGKWQDSLITMIANILVSVPSFVVGVVMLYFFCMKLKLLPSSGFTWPWDNLGMHLKQVIMPLICLSLGGVAGVCRQTRSSMLEAIRQDYVRTARSKGLEEKVVIRKHVLRNGLVPVVTMIGGRLSMMFGMTVFVESVYAIPGMGQLMIQSVNNMDIPVMQGCVMLSALVISLAYLLTDFLYVLVDPRISLS